MLSAVRIVVLMEAVMNKGQQIYQTLHRVATNWREEIKGTTKQKMVRRHSKEGGNHLEQESIRKTTLMEGIDGGRATFCSGWTKPK